MRRLATQQLAKVTAGAAALCSLQALRSPHPCFRQVVSTQQRFVGHSRLNASLKAELQEEMSREDKTACPEVPPGWTIQHAPGSNFFTMKKTYQDETMEVHCVLPIRDPEILEEKSGNHQEQCPFTLVVSKGGKAVDFTLTAIDGELVLDGIAFYNDAALARDMSPDAMNKKDTRYAGPALPELNEELVESFISYLEERGINDSFAEFIEVYTFWMEQQEYERWLADVAEFSA